MEMRDNLKLDLKEPVIVWKKYKDKPEERQVCYASLIEETELFVLTLTTESDVQEIIWTPKPQSYIVSRIISVIDNFKELLSCEALDANSYEGLDVFQSSMPKYRIMIPQDTKSVTVTYTYEMISKYSSTKLCNLVSAQENESEIAQRKERFCRDAIKDLCSLPSPEAPVPVIQYVEPTAMKNEANDYYEQYLFYKNRYNAVIQSTSWKLTKPLRKGMDILRGNPTNNDYESSEDNKDSVDKACPKGTPWIGVHLHLYYEDLLEEFCGYLNNIPQPFDLYISCKRGANQTRIQKYASGIRHVHNIVIRETPNRGRDIAPFYVLFREELLKYECLLHIHSKKSLYTGQEKAEWRHWALDGVLKNEKSVAETLHYMKNTQPKAGLVFGEMTELLPLNALHWLRNEPKGRELSKRLNIKFETEMFFYPVGSFFWARTDAIKPLFDLNLTYEDFDEEKGQIDATLAHALERVVACLVKQNGFKTYIFDPQTEHFSMEKSYKSFRTYFSYNKDNVGNMLMNYDVVSFDIFDTLITRLIYKPDDIFHIMERLIFEKWNKKVSYLEIRKEAEKLATEQEGDFCNIHHIYDHLPEISIFTTEESLQLKNMEIQLEYDLCIPRKDALDIYNKLIRAGRRVILVSDMYLTEEILVKILNKCGYTGYEDLWISCEKGKRKDKDNLWEEFFKIYGNYSTIHIGDNSHSDCQLVGDHRRNNMLWLSPRDQFHFSEQYEKFSRFIGTSVENSIILGFLVNQCFYNSPFALGEEGFAKINSVSMAAQGVFAPLFLCFGQYLANTCNKDRILLFLAREGYFLQKLYEKYCVSFHKPICENHYFLTSRRTASVAQIREYKDAKDLLQTSYDGKASTFLSERFGLNLSKMQTDQNIHLPQDKNKVIGILTEMAIPILERADYEHETYLSYIQETFGKDFDWKKAILVDVGYAGTIQYYLMKTLNTPLEGQYLVTEYNIKPLALGGICNSLYSFKTSPLFINIQLFLEAVTAAPYGQLICFEKNENQIIPKYKEDSESCWKSAKKLQESILEYVENMGLLFHHINPRFDEELAETVLSEVLRAGIFGKELKGIFTVYDGYCMDGEWVYDEAETMWKLSSRENK